MKKMKMIPLLVLALSLILGFNATAFASPCDFGGFEDPACLDLPDPTDGARAAGWVTVAKDKDQCAVDYPLPPPDGCNIGQWHAVLRRGATQHFYSGPVDLEGGNPCGANADFIKEEFKIIPCNLDIGADFGFPKPDYLPVIENVLQVKEDFCETGDPPDKGMIKFRIRIRFVPVLPAP